MRGRIHGAGTPQAMLVLDHSRASLSHVSFPCPRSQDERADEPFGSSHGRISAITLARRDELPQYSIVAGGVTEFARRSSGFMCVSASPLMSNWRMRRIERSIRILRSSRESVGYHGLVGLPAGTTPFSTVGSWTTSKLNEKQAMIRPLGTNERFLSF